MVRSVLGKSSEAMRRSGGVIGWPHSGIEEEREKRSRKKESTSSKVESVRFPKLQEVLRCPKIGEV